MQFYDKLFMNLNYNFKKILYFNVNDSPADPVLCGKQPLANYTERFKMKQQSTKLDESKTLLREHFKWKNNF